MISQQGFHFDSLYFQHSFDMELKKKKWNYLRWYCKLAILAKIFMLVKDLISAR